MKKIILFLTIMILFTACSDSMMQNVFNELEDNLSNISDSDNEYVQMVKNGYREDNPNLTYGEAFSNFFGSPKWKYFKSEDGEDIVEFAGDCTYQDIPVKARIQFVVNKKNGAFEAQYLEFNEVPQSILIMVALFQKAFENDEYIEEEPEQQIFDISTSEITKEILENIDFPSAVEKRIEEINYYINLNTSLIVDISYYICGSGAYPDELLLIRFINKKAAEDAKPEVQKRLDSQIEIFNSYTPDEMYKLESSVIKTKDEYLFFYATADNNKVDEIINSFLK